MWLFLEDAVVEIVAAPDAPDGPVIVRARHAGEIERLFAAMQPAVEVERVAGDFSFQSRIDRGVVVAAIGAAISRIRYTSVVAAADTIARRRAYIDVLTGLTGLQGGRARPLPPPFIPRAR